jgi:hypothetical protein
MNFLLTELEHSNECKSQSVMYIGVAYRSTECVSGNFKDTIPPKNNTAAVVNMGTARLALTRLLNVTVPSIPPSR